MTQQTQKFLLQQVDRMAKFLRDGMKEPEQPTIVKSAHRIVKRWNHMVWEKQRRRRARIDKQILAVKQVIYIDNDPKKAARMLKQLERLK